MKKAISLILAVALAASITVTAAVSVSAKTAQTPNINTEYYEPGTASFIPTELEALTI